MASEVIMPQLGESVVEGTVTKWLKTEGEIVTEFEALLEVNTDKVDTEIPSPSSGTLLRVYVHEGQTVNAGTLLAMIGEAGDDVPDVAPAQPAATEIARSEADPVVPTPEPTTQRISPKPGRSKDLGFISPVVARIAAEHSVALDQVQGTGRGGRITKKDVLAHLDAGPSPVVAPWEEPALGELFRPSEEVFGTKQKSIPAAEGMRPGSVIPHSPVRRSIAEHMVRSKQVSPHVSTIMEADLSRIVAHRQTNKAVFSRDGVNLTFTAYFLAGSVQALKAVPQINASWSDEGVILHEAVNIGVAVSLGADGLIVPVIKGADQLSLLALATSLNDLAARARERKLEPDEVQGGTFTLTNHGVSGSLFATPIISQPQAAILGVGAIQKRVIAIEVPDPAGGSMDAFAIRPMAYLTLTFDHRMLDGAIADAFLGTIVQTLENWS
jgi:pyruvate/2-oxoglutarate dehydrogenase complex dihydrolipoamide acyltransferase (E2) component